VSLENTTDSVTPDPQAALEAAPIAPAPAAFTEPEAPHDIDIETPAGPPVEPPRGAIAEWAITILLLLFLTTTLVQAYVIPTGSMEDTLLIGDHLLVDKMAFAPSGAVSKHILPYSDVKRGDIIGRLGATGRATGYHLHYEVRIAGAAVNPLPYIQTDQLGQVINAGMTAPTVIAAAN